MELNEALGRISEIQVRLARTETVRDFRSLTVGLSGVVAIATALIQAYCLPQPAARVDDYVRLWVAVALVNLLVVGTELTWRWYGTASPLQRRLSLLAIGQFTPCLAAGGTITAIVATRAPHVAWMLPGLWSIVFGLGVMACCRLLPRATIWVGVHYLAAGSICLAIGDGSHAFSPWMMVGAFGLGQLLSAGILYHTLERDNEHSET